MWQVGWPFASGGRSVLSGGLCRWCTCASWLRRVTDFEELGDARAAHDGCDHCRATLVGVHLDTEGAGGIRAHRHTERGSLIHEEHSLPLRCDPAAAHCGRSRPACGVHGGSQHEDGQAARRSHASAISRRFG
eukprot:scaffold6078_cov72-Phaeocystis_antarctica.AAC.3